jgi:rubrerythrin
MFDCVDLPRAKHWDGHTEADAETRLMSLQPERKKGKWIETDDGWDGTYWVCSNCGCPWTLIDGDPKDNGMNYCPNCGCSMKGDSNVDE